MPSTYTPSVGSANAATDIGATVTTHIQAINGLLSKLKGIAREAEEVQLAIGEHILAIKAAEPGNWESVVKSRCGISRSRAYELMAIAEGTKSAEQTRRETNVRLTRHRQKRAVRFETDRRTRAVQHELAATRAELAKVQAAHARQIERYEAKIAQLGDAEALNSKCDGLRTALDKVSKLLSEVRGLTGHYAHNRSDIIAKINRAKTVADTALQAAMAATCNSAVMPTTRAA